MQMDYLEIEQFRGIRGLRLKRLGDVNLLLGDNDAGKTSVLEAIKLFEQPWSIDALVRNSRTRFVNTTATRDVYTQLESFLDIFPFDQEEYKYIALGAGIDGRYHDLSINGVMGEVLRPVSGDELRGSERRRLEMSEQEVLTFRGELRFYGDQIPFEIDEFFRSRLSSTFRSGALLPIVYVAPGGHLGSQSNYLLRMGKQQELETVELLRLIDPDIEGFKLQPNEISRGINQVIEHRRFGDIPLYTYGDGMKKILSLAVNVRKARNGILLIDEIETSLQASILRRVFGWLLEACRKFDVQLFVTTHSLESIAALVRCAVERLDSELACYRLEKEPEQVYAKRFSESELHSLVNGRGIDVR